VSGSYCLALNREIVVKHEHLSLAPADGNTHPSHIGKPVQRYDTFDRANEILLQKGYRCVVIPEEERDEYTIAFHGVSNGVMLLEYFQTREETLDYFLSPPRKQWSGNTLFRAFSALLTISAIQELAKRIRGKISPLSSLPSREALEKVRREVEPYLRDDHSFREVDRAIEQLRSVLSL
jgi:hypothetical protein